MAKRPDKPEGFFVRGGPLRLIEYAVCADGTMPAKEFYDSLPAHDQAKFNALFLKVANYSEQKLKKNKFGPEWDEFWAFKSQTDDKRMMRIACIRFKSRWLLLHGFYKPAQARWTKSDNSQCEIIIREHVEVWEPELKESKQ